MKLVRIIRHITLNCNETQKEFFDFQEKTKHFLVLRPNEQSNKQLDKDSIMQPKGKPEMGSTNLLMLIWCFDYQEKEAEEVLEEAVKKVIEKEKEWLNKQLENLSALSNKAKTEINIMY